MHNNIAILGSSVTAKLLALTLNKYNIPCTLIGDFETIKNNFDWYYTLNRSSLDTLYTIGIELSDLHLTPIYSMNLYDCSSKEIQDFSIDNSNYNYNALGFTANKNTLSEIVDHKIQHIPKIQTKNITITKENNFFIIQNEKFKNIANTIDNLNPHIMTCTKKEYDYQQIACIGNLHYQHNFQAIQSFNHSGTLGLLPTINPHNYNFVLATNNHDLEASLLKHLEHLKLSAPKFELLNTVPLKSSYTYNLTNNNALLFGDSLRKIHPLAGLGLNLTMSDLQIIIHLIKKPWQSLIISYNNKYHSNKL